jgi:hypothetical protein
MQIVTIVVQIVTFIGDLAAVAWFGMWMGVTSRKVAFAVLKTIAFVIVLPWLVIWFAQILFMFAMFSAFRTSWGVSPIVFMTIVGGVLALAKNGFFVWWPRHRLLTQFREAIQREGRIARGGVQLPAAAPPQVPPLAPPPPAAPPVIRAGVGTA